MPPTVVVATIILAVVGLVIGGGLGAWWALSRPAPTQRRPPANDQ